MKNWRKGDIFLTEKRFTKTFNRQEIMAKDILEEIVAHKRIEVARLKEEIPPSVLYKQVEDILCDSSRVRRSMRQSLKNSSSGIIAEFKRKRP